MQITTEELNMRLRDIKARPYPYHGHFDTANSLSNEDALFLNREWKKRTGKDHETVKQWILERKTDSEKKD